MPKKNICGFLLLVSSLLIFSCTEPSHVYFVNSGGNDSNSGRTPETAWKTLEKINKHDFSPGDSILFRGGDVFEGTILLSSADKGNEKSRLVISSYGEGRAIIRGNAKEGLIADSCNYLTIENLVFTGLGRKTGNISDGLLIINCEGVIVNNLETHGFQHSGVHLHQCNNAVIKRVYAHDNGFAGIHVTGNTMMDPEKYDNQNLYIGYCVAENNPGDPTVSGNHSGNGILASSVKGGIIEYCEAFNNGWDMQWEGNGPVGIWIWDCTDVTIQYCISHHNRTNPKAADGGGFDFDGGVSNSIIQYCISHHNEGSGFGLYEFGAAKPWENNIIRYNISQDDAIINAGSLGIWKADKTGIMRNCEIYNNTFYNSNPEGHSIWLYSNYPGFRFRNNVFVYNKSLLSEGAIVKDELFQRNLYWNLKGSKSFEKYGSLEQWATSTGKEMMDGTFTGLFQDPGFRDPGKLELTDPEKINHENLAPFIPKPGSPLINSGLNLKKRFEIDPGSKDILRSAIPLGEKFDIGAIEYNDK
jgi:hypothetical protein